MERSPASCDWLVAAASFLLTAASFAQSTPPRVIAADLAAVKGPKSTVYQRCVGAGRVGEGLRAEWQAQLKTCHDAVGFQYLRCHGLLHDELGVYSEDADGKPIYNWQYIDMVYDFLLSIGVRPFVEIGFMPEALARQRSGPASSTGLPASATAMPTPMPDGQYSKAVFWWGGNVTAPKSWERWNNLVTALVQHWTERYGAAEVRQWYFEIWNEPNHPSFFIPENGSKRREEYFKLYENTARAVKRVDAAYRVGGPSGAGPVWIKELIDFCAQGRVPLDFITFHAYGIGGGPSGLDVNGAKKLYLNKDLRAVADRANSQERVIKASPMPNLPVHITEWSASFSGRDAVHDSYFESPYILEQLKHTEGLASMSYWTFTDIFEEGGPPPTAFHGGFGLINMQGIKKAAFFAYDFLNRLGAQELKNADSRSWVCRDEAGGAQALFWDLTDPRPAGETVTNWQFFRQLLVPKDRPPVTLQLSSLKPGRYQLAVYRTGFQENDAYSEYQKLGLPSQLTRPQVARLQSLATGAPSERAEVTVDASGRWERAFPMRDNEVVLATLTPAK